MTINDLKIERATAIELRPGDVVLLEMPKRIRLGQEALRQLGVDIKKTLGCKVMLLHDGVRFAGVTREGGAMEPHGVEVA